MQMTDMEQLSDLTGKLDLAIASQGHGGLSDLIQNSMQILNLKRE